MEYDICRHKITPKSRRIALITFLNPRIPKEDTLKRLGIKFGNSGTNIANKTDITKDFRVNRKQGFGRKQGGIWSSTIEDRKGHTINKKARSRHGVSPKRIGNIHLKH